MRELFSQSLPRRVGCRTPIPRHRRRRSRPYGKRLRRQRQRRQGPVGCLKPMMLDSVSISSVPLFSHLSAAHLDQVGRLVRLATYKPGETVFTEGTTSSCLLHIIIEGEAVLSKKARCAVTGAPLTYEIEVRGRNQIFGWILRWPRLFGQISRFDKWNVCRG